MMNSSRYAQIPIEVTNSDIEGSAMTLSPGLSVPMRLQFEGRDLSSVTGLDRIEGSLVDTLSQPVRGHQVILIPDQGRDRPELYKQATTDQNGRFTLRGITPGGYKAYAWEVIEANAGTIAKCFRSMNRRASRSASRKARKRSST